MTNHFDSKGGEQNTAQGDHAIGRQENVTQTVRGDGCIVSGTGNVTAHGIPPEVFAQYVKELGATEQVIRGFLNTLLERDVPRDQWDKTLREIAATHKELLLRLEAVQSADPQVARLKDEARQAIDAGDYAKAEELLEDAAKQHSLAAAETYAQLADLQRVQLRYAKAAAYWQRAAALLPDDKKKNDKKKKRSAYLSKAGYDLDRIAKYKEALPLYEHSLSIRREIGDKAGEGVTLNNIGQNYSARGDYAAALTYLEQSLSIHREVGNRAMEGKTLNNISQIYHDRGDYATALKYLEQSLSIRQEIGDKAGEGTTLNNISQIYHDRGDYATALKYLEQSLSIRQEIGDKADEGVTLNNIGKIYDARGDYDKALPLYEQSLIITQEIGDKAGEAVTSWNIGRAYEKQGDLAKAESYINRAVQLMDEIGHPKKDEYRKGLEEVRVKLRGRQSPC